VDEIDIVALFKEAVFEAQGRRLENVTLDSQLSELKLDSIAVMETIGVIEQRLGVRFADEDLTKLSSLRDLEKLVASARRA
jgi:acyl carrier protein